MNPFRTYILLPLFALLFLPAKAQDTCRTAYNTLSQVGQLISFAHASGPGAFKRLVDGSAVGQALATCTSLSDEAWDAIVAAGKTAQQQRTDYLLELKTAALLAVFAYGPQLKRERLKEFVRGRPWNTDFQFPAQLAVDALLLINNDPAHDPSYRTYTHDQMEKALRDHAQ